MCVSLPVANNINIEIILNAFFETLAEFEQMPLLYPAAIMQNCHSLI